MTRRILIDCGNTRVKWAILEGTRWHARGDGDYVDWSALSAELVVGDICYVASVAAAAHERQLAALLANAGLTAVWLSSTAEFGGVTNTYRDPAQLGVDRWMALIAARQRTHGAALVVSAGTAMTVDALSPAGTFLGGLIVPGLAMMRQALVRETARVNETRGRWVEFPQATADAVYSGVIAALCGAIRQQHARLAASAGTPPLCLLTGGDAETLLPHLPLPAEHVPALVLEGIARVAAEES
ncbi:MAG TPA: type III pantothenate kinase [Thiobacillaceae bacterium]|nr:type III pantothenate kinase [Thiobacillaceae bacterium]